MINAVGSDILFAAAYGKSTGYAGATPSSNTSNAIPGLPQNTEISRNPSNATSFINSKGTIGSIEKHIDDYEKGRGDASEAVGKDISRKLQASSTELAGLNPKASLDYSAYLTSLPYSKRARFVDGVNTAVQALAKIA